MEQHSHKLDDKNEAKEEDENQTDRFQLQVFLTNQDLKKKEKCHAEEQVLMTNECF